MTTAYHNIRMDKYIHGGCPLCGERGYPHWVGPKPKPNSANAGVQVFICGIGYRCGTCRGGGPDDPCSMRQVSCYRCGATTRIPMDYPATWEPAYFSWN